MQKTTAQCLDELFEYLGDERWDLADMLTDVCQGDADIFDSHTAELIQDLFESMPESDNMTVEDITKNLFDVGTPFARMLAQDLAIDS